MEFSSISVDVDFHNLLPMYWRIAKSVQQSGSIAITLCCKILIDASHDGVYVVSSRKATDLILTQAPGQAFAMFFVKGFLWWMNWTGS